jgi:Xaa-Pro aminopeptidase
MLTLKGCRARQQRLLQVMEARGWDLFVTGNYRTIYYLSGVLGAAETPALLSLTADGSCSAALPDNVSSLRCGVELASVTGEDATPVILALRKKKHDDEIAEIRASLRLCVVAYDTARAMMQPGLTEIDIHSAMSAAINREAGISVALTGDFACGLRGVRGGGPPTSRKLEAGDLYCLDLFPAPALYFGDVCRTFAVGEPTDAQVRAVELVGSTMRAAEAMVRPGVAARDVYRFVQERLDETFWHHAGHGIGHHGHEAPRLIPESDDVFEEGDVFTIEPGIYHDALQGGIRIEDNYLVHADGVENLFDYPLGLV